VGKIADQGPVSLGGTEPTEPSVSEPSLLPAPPRGVSRVDTLPDSFVKILVGRPVLIGDVIAERYKLLEALGDGAMGQVFIAENLAIGRRVAVKVLKPALLADLTFRQRFQHEAEAIASIEHRNVARFLDMVVGDPTFLVMEYVKGPTLAERLRDEGRMDPQYAAAIAVRLCWALEAAHAAGVVHRDIKPANIILAPDPEVGEEPKLIDFGLAKLAQSSTATGLTRTGQIVGTPEYMSPEQIANKEVDGRSDVYSLGCLLYELIAGRPPFAGTDDIQLLYQQLQRPPEPVTKYNPDTPAELWAVMERALQKDPDARYGSMKEMARALERLDATVARRRLERQRRRPTWLLVGLVALLAIGMGITATRALIRMGSSGGALLLASRPSGAAVEVDGKPLDEPTPTVARGLGPGRHTVRFKKGKLALVERQVSLEPAERAVVNVVLPPTSRHVEIRSVPEGATVYLDGRLGVGVTPTTVDVTEEEFHELRVEKTGFETATRALTPDDHDPMISVVLAPERLPRATLYVDANTAAAVYLDGVDTSYTTPTIGLHIAAGEHTVEVRDGTARASTHIKLEKGQTLRVLLSPSPDGKKP
jgi:tRNA A-37 threonylcarbamoyl transferase component Bud32